MDSVSDPHASVPLLANNVDDMRSLSTTIHVIGCSVLSFCVALRSHREDFFSIHGLQSISWTRWLVIIVFVDSWLFIFFAGMLVNGVGISSSDLACELGIFICIFFYSLSKVFIYLFLIERVYIVWPNRGLTRWTSTTYRVCIATMTGYGLVFIAMILDRIAFRQHNGQCIIGLGKISSLSLLLYDLFLNFFLTGMFLYPLRQNKFLTSKLQRVARRTLAAATMSLITSAVNIAVLTILHGQELGWVCLGSCGTDITVNALVLFWVTGAKDEAISGAGPSPSPTPQTNDLSTVVPSSLVENSKPVLDSQNTLALQQDLPVRQLESAHGHAIHFSVTGRDDRMRVVQLPHNGEGAIPETVTSESRHEFGLEKATRRRTNSSNHRQSIVTRFMQALGFGGHDNVEELEGHSMSVQVTVTTQTDAMMADDKQRQHRSESISSRPQDPAMEQQYSTDIGASMNEDLEHGRPSQG